MYRKHIEQYAHLVRPITKLTNGHPVAKGKNVKIVWTPEADDALKRLKKATAESAMLKFPDFSQEFHVFADASQAALGGMIGQMEDKEMRPIAFYSRALSVAERNYSVIDKEALSIHFVLESAKNWLLGWKVIIRSDHMPLRYILLNQSDNPRLFRWKYLLQEYGAELFFIKGEKNVEADYISRYSWRSPASYELVAMQDHFIHASKDSPLPVAYPENFLPDVWKTPFKDIDPGIF